MKLKSIKIQGFKSFDDLSQIDFDKRMTCIVGPNGCGKSNVVDAIRWVMGEQSAKHLRGKSMDDIIFVGSQSRQPSSLASVEITFIKDETSGFPIQYENCEEVSIGRHLYRTGESEYFINKQNVRLKDITDFFLGTGVGTKAYSIIEQGRVEQLLTAKPEERRYIIEEAAGISKFKSRKEAALRRMDATNTNLSRLNDIIIELERQVASLDRQAKKAKRFRVISDELKDLDLKLASLAFESLDKDQNGCLVIMKESDARVEELGNVIAQDETWVEEKRLILAEVETSLNDLQQKVYEWENYLQLAESKLQSRKHESQRITDDLESLEKQLSETKNNLQGNKNGLAQINEKLYLAELDCEALDQSVSEQELVLLELEESSQTLFDTLEKTREDFQKSSHILVDIVARREGMEQRIYELEQKHEHDTQELEELTQKYRKLETLLKESSADLASVKQLKLSLGEKTQDLSQNLIHEEDLLKKEQAELEGVKEDLLGKKSRLQSLRELEKNFEGYHEGPRQILKRKQSGEWESVKGAVADFIEVDKQHEGAVSAVLGEAMQSVVVDSQTDSLSCAEYLKSGKLGRGSFIPLSLQAQATNSNQEVCGSVTNMGSGVNMYYATYLGDEDVVANQNSVQKTQTESGCEVTGEGVKGYLSQFVKMKADYDHLALVLFGDVVLVDGLKNALETWVSYKKPVVTYDGEFISQKGIITGGTLADTSKSLLEKKREIKFLEEVIGGLVNAVSEKEQLCQSMRQKITAIKTELEDVKSFSHQEDLNMANQEKDIVHFNHEMESLNSRRSKLSQTIIKTAENIEDLTSKKEELCAEEIRQQDIKDEAGAVIDQRKSEEDACRRDLANKQENLTKEKINLARAKEQKAYLLQETERLISEDVRLRHEIIRLTEKQSMLSSRFEFVGARIAFLNKYIEKIIGQKDTLDVSYQESKNEYETINASLRDRETVLKASQRERNEMKDTLNQATVRLTELRAELSRHNEQILERYQLVLSEIFKDNMPDLETFAVEESKERASELRRKLSNIGNVNLGAIDELEELSERFEFLSTQKKDLEDSLSALERAIQKINRTTKKRFQETFELVNSKFTKIFPRLFKGGHAYLELTDPENILETGVDIIAQPPGKKLQSVSLLSGGEKALTAISLLFAIFLIKPSPFCLLDEVDAPLDDVNVDRYNEIVKELAQNTQFIVITHNKRTMQATNCLFGVTMQEGGVSKIVSVTVDD